MVSLMLMQTDSVNCSGISIADFEQVNVVWVSSNGFSGTTEPLKKYISLLSDHGLKIH